MPWPVYTERFLSTGQPNQWMDYVVPPGQRAILKWVSASHWGEAGMDLNVTVAAMYVLTHHFPASMSTINVPVLAVAYGGERMSVLMQGESSQCHLSGYLLTDPSGRTGPPAGPAQQPEVPHEPGIGPSR